MRATASTRAAGASSKWGVPGPCPARSSAARTLGHQRLQAATAEPHPARCDTQTARSPPVHLQGVAAPEVQRDRRWRLHRELPGRTPRSGRGGIPSRAPAGIRRDACERPGGANSGPHFDRADRIGHQAELSRTRRSRSTSPAMTVELPASRPDSPVGLPRMDEASHGPSGRSWARRGHACQTPAATTRSSPAAMATSGALQRRTRWTRVGPVSRRKSRDARTMPQRGEEVFETHDLRVGLSRSIPEVVVVHLRASLRPESLPQLLHPAMEVHAHRRRRESRSPRNLLARHAFDEAKHQRLPVGRWQGPDDGQHAERRDSRPRRPHPGTSIVTCSAVRTPVVIHRTVPGDGGQPASRMRPVTSASRAADTRRGTRPARDRPPRQ